MNRDTLDKNIHYWAGVKPLSDAIISLRSHNSVNYEELNTLVNQYCHTLAGMIRPEERCVLVLDDTIACHAVIHAIFRLGAVLIPIDPQLGLTTRKNIIRHVEPHHLLLGEQHQPEVWEAEAGCNTYIFSNKTPEKSTPYFTSLAQTNKLAMIAYTSGTTKDPKGVTLKHKHLISAYRSASKYMYAPSRVGCVFRMATLGTLGIHFFYAQQNGAATVLLPELNILNAKDFWTNYKKHHIDFVYLVPSLVKLLNHFGKAMEEHPGGLAVSAGAPLPEHEQTDFQHKFNIPLRNIYGLTESSFAVFYGQQNENRGTNTIGKPLSVAIRIIDNNGNEVEKGEMGELTYRGPMVSEGYFKNDGANAETFIEGWLHTGDLVRADEANNLKIVGRKKDLIIRGGFNIHLQEIEEFLLSQPNVINACALGRPNPVKGEELLACVQVKKFSEPFRNTLIEQVKNELGSFRSPDVYLITETPIPLNASGKIDKKGVLDMFNIKTTRIV